MTTTKIDVEPTVPCECANCEHTCPGGDLDLIRDIGQRLDPGSKVPAGQCPKCGALSYLVELTTG